MKENRQTTITARVTIDMKERFITKANKEAGKSPSDVLRELVAFYLSNRTKKELSK